MVGDVEFIDQYLRTVKGRLTIEELVAGITNVPTEYRRRTFEKCLKSDIRRCIKRLKMPDGLAVWHSVREIDPETQSPVDRYVQLELFDREDYARVWKSWDRSEKRFRRWKTLLSRRYSDRFGGESLKQFVLAFMGEESPTPAVLVPSEIVSESSPEPHQFSQELARHNPR